MLCFADAICHRGADDGSTTNMVEELKQLRARTDALEKKLSETSPAAPAAATVRLVRPI